MKANRLAGESDVRPARWERDDRFVGPIGEPAGSGNAGHIVFGTFHGFSL
jgi:hypothetical protein